MLVGTQTGISSQGNGSVFVHSVFAVTLYNIICVNKENWLLEGNTSNSPWQLVLKTVGGRS